MYDGLPLSSLDLLVGSNPYLVKITDNDSIIWRYIRFIIGFMIILSTDKVWPYIVWYVIYMVVDKLNICDSSRFVIENFYLNLGINHLFCCFRILKMLTSLLVYVIVVYLYTGTASESTDWPGQKFWKSLTRDITFMSKLGLVR